MTTGVVNKRRRMLARTVAGLAVAGLGFGSLLLAAMTAATLPEAEPAGPTPSPSAAVAAATPTPTATPVESAAPASLSPMPDAPSPAPTPTPGPTVAPTPHVREFFVAPGTEPGLAADPFHAGVVAVVTQNVVMQSPTNGCSGPSIRVSHDGGAT